MKYACLNYHYSESVPVVRLGYSVFSSLNEWCGVIMYGSGANLNLGKKYGLVQGEVCELVRVALNGKQESTSKSLSISLRLIKKECPLLKLVISYADMSQGHVGTIYQATNWLYEGLNQVDKKGTPSYLIHGKKLHGRTLYSKGWKQNIDWIKENVDKNVSLIWPKGKHKYLYPLREINLDKYKCKEYPKATEAKETKHLITNEDKGGSSPTLSLKIA